MNWTAFEGINVLKSVAAVKQEKRRESPTLGEGKEDPYSLLALEMTLSKNITSKNKKGFL